MEYIQAIFGKDSSWFWSMCQFFVITITLIMVYQQVRIQRKSNMLQTLHKCDEKWGGNILLKCRSHASQDYIKGCLNLHEEEVILINFFEDLGLYVHEGILSKNIVWDSYSYYIERYWPLLEPAITERHASNGDESIGEKFKSLHEKMQKYSKKKKAPSGPFKKEELVSFAKHEQNLIVIESS
ncbi:hypothetical protein [Pseudoalteromonas sp. OANN1]|nr:hypothetical protein [Pseudoalteromonas sp. OANN1]MCO7201886.1 hypothetical protein [Pseudoalteromonas sp. OANN1]